MGCSQSKATDQVVERVSVDTLAVEAPAPESVDVLTSESAVAAPPATAEELPPAPTSVPVEAVEEDEPAADEPAAPVEVVAEQPADPTEEVSEAAEESAPAPVEEAPVEEAAAPVEEVAKAPASVQEEAPKSEEKVSETEAEEVEADAAPTSEAVIEEEEAPKSEPAVEEALVEEEAPVEEPKSEVVAAAPVSEAKPTEGSLTFTAEDVTFNDKGVAFYNFDGSDSNNPANDLHVSKRYSEFKALHAQLTDNQDGKASDLPVLPKASFLQGRKNKKMLQDRKTQFTALLNAIAAHPVASQSDAFKAFLA